QSDHQMRKVLTDAGAMVENFGDRASGIGDALAVGESICQEMKHAKREFAKGHALFGTQQFDQILKFGAGNDWPAELEVVPGRVVVGSRGDGPPVGKALRLYNNAVGLDDTGGDDANLAVKCI